MKACSIDDCDIPVKRAGLCYGHYMRQWRYGDPLWTAPPRWDDLTGQAFGSLTVLHRRANGWVCRCECGDETFARTGDLNRGTAATCGDPAKHRRLDYAGYGAAHQRVRSDRGDVKTKSCVECAGQARHWSYNHDDPDELLGTTGRSTRLIAYSLKPEHYSPRCVPCHKNFDLGRRDAA